MANAKSKLQGKVAGAKKMAQDKMAALKNRGGKSTKLPEYKQPMAGKGKGRTK